MRAFSLAEHARWGRVSPPNRLPCTHMRLPCLPHPCVLLLLLPLRMRGHRAILERRCRRSRRRGGGGRDAGDALRDGAARRKQRPVGPKGVEHRVPRMRAACKQSLQQPRRSRAADTARGLRRAAAAVVAVAGAGACTSASSCGGGGLSACSLRVSGEPRGHLVSWQVHRTSIAAARARRGLGACLTAVAGHMDRVPCLSGLRCFVQRSSDGLLLLTALRDGAQQAHAAACTRLLSQSVVRLLLVRQPPSRMSPRQAGSGVVICISRPTA